LDCGAQAQPVGVEGDDGGGAVFSIATGRDGNFCRDSRKDGDNLKHDMKKQKTDWEQVRINAAIAAMQTLIPGEFGKRDNGDIAGHAVEIAEALVDYLTDASDIEEC
jgi:hypothetical protein